MLQLERLLVESESASELELEHPNTACQHLHLLPILILTLEVEISELITQGALTVADYVLKYMISPQFI